MISFFFFSSRRRHTRLQGDWSSDVCSSDLEWFDGPFDQLATGEEPSPLKWLSMAPPGHDPPPPRVRLDLCAANRWQLLDAGVKASNIISSELCTSCRTDLLFSYRREHARTGRLMAIIGLREK